MSSKGGKSDEQEKRLMKGIESLEKEILIHEKKLGKVQQEDNLEFSGYYRKEIEAKGRYLEEKKRLLEKGG